MAGHTQPLAKAVYDALKASGNLRPTVDALYAELDFSHGYALWLDVGPGGVILVCRPGYGPLSDPMEFVEISMRA